MNNVITVNESFEWIGIKTENGLTEKQFDELYRYILKTFKKKQVIEHGYNKFRFINYVGFIQLSSIGIEVLPKINLQNDSDSLNRKVLLMMLSKSGFLPISSNEISKYSNEKLNLLEILSSLFIKYLSTEIKKGHHFDYIKTEENLNYLKGKLKFSNHIKHNYSNRIKAYVEYDLFSDNNYINKIFKLTLLLIVKNVKNSKIQLNAKQLLLLYSDITLEKFSIDKMSSYIFDRRNIRFKNSFLIAQYILTNSAYSKNNTRNEAFSFIFEMNYLFEIYISKIIKRLWEQNNTNTAILQDKSKYLLLNLLKNRKNINLKPDIVLYSNSPDFQNVIIDAKWKRITDNKVYQISDLYQMYAYLNSYQESKKCFIIFPYSEVKINLPSWKLLNNKDKEIEIKTVRLDSYNNTENDLKEIIQYETS